MGTCREASAQLFRRGVAVGLFGAILCFAAGVASTQESTKASTFHVPVYRRPRDLVAAGYSPASIAFPNKGARIGRRTANNEIVPYYDRGAIEAGALDGQKLEICWLKDPFDLLTMQIEGSAPVILEDGTPLRISYDSHNGYGYSSIERVLVERNLIPLPHQSDLTM